MKKVLLFFVLFAVFTACSKDSFEPEGNGLLEQKFDERTFEEKIKSFAISNYADFLKEREGNFLNLPEIESIEPIVSEIDNRAEFEKDTVAYIVNFDKKGSMVVAGSRILPLSVVAFCDSKMSVVDTIGNKGLATFIELLPNYYYQEVGQRIIDFGLATREEVVSYTRGDLLHFSDQLELLGDTPSPFIPININDYINGNVATPTTVVTYDKIENLVDVEWGQGDPFNLMAEIVSCDGVDVLAPAGCVAIAVAQITTCHKHPKILEGNELDWSVLSKTKAKDFVTPYEKHVIASYIRKIGVYCGNDWGCFSTSASSKTVPSVFRKLGYTSTKLIRYNKDRVNKSLQQGNPVFIRGSHPEGGHAWVIDGSLQKNVEEHYFVYNSEGVLEGIGTGIRHWMYFYCNWGARGAFNGYFLDNVFNTANGFSYYDEGGYLQPKPSNSSGCHYRNLKIVTDINPKK